MTDPNKIIKPQISPRNLTENNVTECVLSTLHGDNPREKRILTSLIKHLHGFVRETEPTMKDWEKAIDFLTKTGQMCDENRQEFILLSDVLGVSILLDAINHRTAEDGTKSTLLGPFWVDGAKEYGESATLVTDSTTGPPMIVSGIVTDTDGKPIEGAKLDIWHGSAEGKYDVQLPGAKLNMRGILRTGKDGKYMFRSIKPVSYPVPHDGTCGDVLRAMGRHPMRPAHIHFLITADGYKPLTTHIFEEGNKYLESDAVFAVKNELIVDWVKHTSQEEAERRGVPKAPFYTVEFDFKLTPIGMSKL